MNCPDCQGTGWITLLISRVQCLCKSKIPIPTIDLKVVNTAERFQSMNPPHEMYSDIEGTVERSRHIYGQNHEIIVMGNCVRYRFIMECSLDVGIKYRFWLYKNPIGQCKVQPTRVP